MHYSIQQVVQLVETLRRRRRLSVLLIVAFAVATPFNLASMLAISALGDTVNAHHIMLFTWPQAGVVATLSLTVKIVEPAVMPLARVECHQQIVVRSFLSKELLVRIVAAAIWILTSFLAIWTSLLATEGQVVYFSALLSAQAGVTLVGLTAVRFLWQSHARAFTAAESALRPVPGSAG